LLIPKTNLTPRLTQWLTSSCPYTKLKTKRKDF
jgi:hypothetical protein